MQTFATARDAKEFLVSKIITESEREAVPLSEVERKMLFFSETVWTLPDIAEVNDIFDRQYNRAEYEQKIRKLIRNMCTKARADNREEFDAWTKAVRTIRREDHYILVLIAAADAPVQSAGRFLKLLAVAIVVACVILTVGYLFLSR